MLSRRPEKRPGLLSRGMTIRRSMVGSSRAWPEWTFWDLKWEKWALWCRGRGQVREIPSEGPQGAIQNF